jgi:ABC-type uncharacterized transport system involved in gliding motility auxiliary subunit
MNALNTMKKKTLGIAAVVLAIILFISVNVLSSTLFSSARLDLTDNGLFTLSEGTLKVLKSIDEPITLRFYTSRVLAEESPAHGKYITRVREFIENYVDLADGKLIFQLHNPEPYSEEEDEAVAYGLQGVPLNKAGDLGYFGLAASNSTDDQQVIAFFDGQREPYLEYDLTRMIHNLANPKKKVIGLMSILPMAMDPTAGRRPWTVYEYMKEFFEVRAVNPDVDAIPEDVDVLMVVHPQGIKDKTLYAIDQFVLGGGKAMVFVDPHSETLVAASAAMRRQLPVAASEVKKLFDAWGVEFNAKKFVGDIQNAVKVNAPSGGRTVAADYIAWLQFDNRNVDPDDVITGQLQRLLIPAAGALQPKTDSGIEFKPLIVTGTQAQQIDAVKVSYNPDPIALSRAFKSEDKSFTLAARVRGNVKSAFPDGPPKEEKKKEDDKAAAPAEDKQEEDKDAEKKKPREHLKESKGPVNLILVGDADLLADRFWLTEQDFFGRRVAVPTANNADFVINALDNLTGSDALISLRSRGLSVRPFHRVVALRQEAEQRYLKTEQDLLEKMRETQRKLGDVQVEDGGEGKVILTEKQKADIEGFRAELLSIRHQLRDVQHALRKDIDVLDTWLKIVNIWAVPVLVSIIAVVMAVLRGRRRRQRFVAG